MTRVGIGVLLVLSAVGVLALISMLADASGGLWRWGYIAAMLSFLVSAGQMAPVLAMSSRVGRGYWAARLRRVADLLGVVGIISAPLLILTGSRLPEWRGRPSIWFD